MSADLESGNPRSSLRVLIIVSKSSSSWSYLWNATEEFLPKTISSLQEYGFPEGRVEPDLPFKLLVKKKFHLLLFIVFDVCNQNYDAVTGHLPCQNMLPVVVVRYRRNCKVTVSVATPAIQERVNRETGEIHNLTGYGSTPPFVVDHTTTVPHCFNPRDVSLLK